MLEALLSIILIILLIYFSSTKQGFVLCFCLFFYVILDILLEKAGFLGNRMLIRFVFILMIINYKHFKINYSNFHKDLIVRAVFLLFFALLIHNIIIYSSSHFDERIEYQNNFFLYSFIPFFITLFAIDNKKKLNQFTDSIIYFGLLFYLLFYFYIDIDKIVIGERETISETMKFDSIGLSRTSGIIFIASFMYIISNKFSKTKILPLILLITSLVFILLSAQRGTIIGIVFAFVVFLIYNKQSQKSKYLFIFIIISLTIVFLTGILDLSHFGILQRFSELQQYQEFERFDDYSSVWNIFKDNHFLIGEGSMGYYFKTGRVYPHSMILELTSEYGILGLISGLIIIITGAKYAFIIIKNSIYSYQAKIIANVWLMMLVSVMVSGNIVYNHLFFVLTALLISIYRYQISSNIISSYEIKQS